MKGKRDDRHANLQARRILFVGQIMRLCVINDLCFPGGIIE